MRARNASTVAPEPIAILLLKLTLVPALIAGVTLAARRWGPWIGGLLVGLPVVAGPTLCFYAVEQGPAFAARAASGTLLSLVALTVFCVVYAHVCRRGAVAMALVVAYAAWGIVAFLLEPVRIGPSLTLAIVFAACAAGWLALPTMVEVPPALQFPRWDLPLRMASAGALVLLLTSLAERLGPTWSGLLTPFPVATAVIAAFTQAHRGAGAVLAFFDGFVPAITAFATFCFVLAVTLEALPVVWAVLVALVAHLAVSALLLWTGTRRLATMRHGRA